MRGHLELLDDDPDERGSDPRARAWTSSTGWAASSTTCSSLAQARAARLPHLSTSTSATLTDELLREGHGARAARSWSLDVRGRASIVADRQRLTQAMIQLAENAVRLQRRRRPIALGSSIAGGEARFWVRDHGPGIAPQEQTAIFERFQRGAATGRTDGAGLGLPIVKAIAEAHHGRVELVSAPGSRFAASRSWSRSTSPQSPIEAEEAAVTRILIAEDEDRDRLLPRAGPARERVQRPRSSPTATKLSDEARSGRFDLLILDLGLPGRTASTSCGSCAARPAAPGRDPERTGQHRRHRARARRRRRRLHHEAVPLRRAARPGAGPAAGRAPQEPSRAPRRRLRRSTCGPDQAIVGREDGRPERPRVRPRRGLLPAPRSDSPARSC